MNAMNTTTIASVVKAIFNLKMEESFLAWVEPVAYEFGIFKELDVALMMSELYKTRQAIVNAVWVDDTALQDRPREGSLNDPKYDYSGHCDEEENKKTLEALLVDEGTLWAKIDWLQMCLVEETSPVVQRNRSLMQPGYKPAKQYRPYGEGWETWVAAQVDRAQGNLDQLLKDESEGGTRSSSRELDSANFWLLKYKGAQELEGYHPDIHPSDDNTAYGLVSRETLDAKSIEAWLVNKKKWGTENEYTHGLQTRLEVYGRELARHEDVVSAIQEKMPLDIRKEKVLYNTLMSERSREDTLHRENLEQFKRDIDWWLEVKMPILRHLPTPSTWLDDVEWEILTIEKETRETNASTRKLFAQTRLLEGQMANLAATDAQMDMFRKNAEITARMRAVQEEMENKYRAQVTGAASPASPASPAAHEVSVTTTVVAPRVRFNIIGAGQKHR